MGDENDIQSTGDDGARSPLRRGVGSCGMIVLAGIICVAIVVLAALKAYERTLDTATRQVKLASATLEKLFSENRQFNVVVANILDEERQTQLQFKKRQAILYFQLARWRDGGTERFLAKPGTGVRAEVEKQHVSFGQYTIAEAHAPYEFTFNVNLANQGQWRYYWNGERRTLTVVAPAFKPPNVSCNEPGRIGDLEIRVVVDCVSFYEPETRRILSSKIPELKKKAALRQLSFCREDARRGIKDFFSLLIPRMTGAKKNDITIEVKFSDEIQPKRMENGKTEPKQ